MPKRLSIAIFLTLSVVVGGCTGAKTGTQPSVQASSIGTQRPPLVIPSHFDSTADKRSFAIQAVKDGYYAEAKPLLEEVVVTLPDPEAYQKLGTARYNVQDYPGAVDAWTKAGELSPSMLAEMQNNIGNARRDAKQLPEAESAYRKALEVDPTRWTAATNLAVLLHAQNRTNEAVAVLEQAVEANKDVPAVASLLASLKK